MDPAVFWCTVRRVVGISGIRQGSVVAERYRVIERLTRFAVADSALTGVEYEYWLALDETREVEVWLQIAESRGVVAAAQHLAPTVSSLRRLNHPAVPAVLDFGESEVVVREDGAAEDEGFAAAVGYVVLEPVEAESLATVLLRGALTEAEILAVLVAVADILKVLHEVELVHGHLSAYSFLLVENNVLLVDLAAAVALEAASGSELTPAADVYALAWLACLALAGVEAVEAEFGVGFDAGSSPESSAAPQLLTIDLIERRRAWAAANLVQTYGVRVELAALLIGALGEASGRPTVSELAAALYVREDVQGAAAGVGAAAALAAAGVGAAVAAEGTAAAEAVEAIEVAEAWEAEAAQLGFVESAELVESAEVVGGAEVVGAGVGAGFGVGVAGVAEAGGFAVGSMGGGSGRSAAGRAGAGTATAVGSVPVTPTSSPAGRHGSPPRRPRSAFYVALGIVVLAVGGIAWGCAASGSSSISATPAPIATPTSGQTSGGQPGASASPSATAGESAGAGATASATASAGAQASSTPGSGYGYTPTPLPTIPASPGQALQQIKQTVSQAASAGQIPPQATGPLNQAIDTLQREISSGSSVQPGIDQLRGALRGNGIPSGFVAQMNELIPYLVERHGS